MADQECKNCGKNFRDYQSNNRKYCSRKCKASSQIVDTSKTCIMCASIFKSHKKNAKFCSFTCVGKNNSIILIGSIPWNKGKRMLQISGSKHWNWKGGNLRGNRGAGQRRFRNAVLERDNYTCTECGAKDKKLIADHIKPYAFYPELRESVDNGRTLCHDCNHYSTYVAKDWAVRNG